MKIILITKENKIFKDFKKILSAEEIILIKQ